MQAFEDIHRADDADQDAVVIDDEEPVYVQSDHVADDAAHRRVRGNGEDRGGHQVSDGFGTQSPGISAPGRSDRLLILFTVDLPRISRFVRKNDPEKQTDEGTQDRPHNQREDGQTLWRQILAEMPDAGVADLSINVVASHQAQQSADQESDRRP